MRQLRSQVAGMAKLRLARSNLPSPEAMRRLREEGAVVATGNDGSLVVIKIGYERDGNWVSLIEQNR